MSEDRPDRSAPVDFDRLDLVRRRFAGDDRFERVEWRPEYAPNEIVCIYARGYYPSSIVRARLEIVWYENEDFSIHYHEDHVDGAFDHRWDRHPSGHDAREHVHPGPDASTPGEDFSYPTDWRAVLSTIVAEVEERQRAFRSG